MNTRIPSVMTTTTFYKHVVVDIPYAYMKYVVGKKGVHLKQCCSTSGVNSVWFNTKRNVVEIYGPSDKLEKASSFLEKRMEKVRAKVPSTEMEEYKKTMSSTCSTDTQVSGSLEGALTREEVKYLIGKKGKHFKTFTKEANVSFIWYDDVNHNVVIWGPQENLNTAVQLLFKQIEKIKNYKPSSINDVDMGDQ